MSINHAVLGILSSQPLSGYDLKRIMQDSPFMPWSGNNNQIYKALVELLEEGWVTHETEHQESLPAKKIYSITDKGLIALKEWVQTEPNLPEFKHSFLVQLAWAETLCNDELAVLLWKYESHIRLQLSLRWAEKERGFFSPSRSEREKTIWTFIYEHDIFTYENELHWLARMREKLGLSVKDWTHLLTHEENPFGGIEEIQYEVVTSDKETYILVTSPIRAGHNGLDLIAACAEHETSLVLIPASMITDDFFKLNTGLAATILQKFTNYHIRAAAILELSTHEKSAAKVQNDTNLRFFAEEEHAVRWLLNTNGGAGS